MGYLPEGERDIRLKRVRDAMLTKEFDVILVYYDELNVGNGWYLTGWCPQFESGSVLVPREGECMILGGPESEPFAKLDSAIAETRNVTAFMVPEEEYPNATITDFPALYSELQSKLGRLKRIGLVGIDRMPAECHRQIAEGFKGVALADFTSHFVKLRCQKTQWEVEQIRTAFTLADGCYEAMKAKIAPGVSEIEVAAAGEFTARQRGASGFGFTAIVGSGKRSNAVVPTATLKTLDSAEMVMIGIAPKVRGYAGVVGDTLPASGHYTEGQKEYLKHLKEAFSLTKECLLPGRVGKEIDAPARAYFAKRGLSKYLVCPFVHTIGLHESEPPFFGPHSIDRLEPGMTVCVDVSLFGHPEFNGVRIESGYEISDRGPVPMSPKMDRVCSEV
jgi:Xaa-Pro aminopeptidase